MDKYDARQEFGKFILGLITYLHRSIEYDIMTAKPENRNLVIGAICNYAIRMSTDGCPPFDRHQLVFIDEYYNLVDELHRILSSVEV
jgi:hypothetical protein